MTYDTIRGQFLQDLNWSRFRPTELHNFAKNVGVWGKRKSLKCLIFRDLPNLKSFKSGATRNRTGDTRIFSPLLYQLSYGTFVIAGAKIGIIFNTAIVWQRKYEIFVQREWKSFFLFWFYDDLTSFFNENDINTFLSVN